MRAAPHVFAFLVGLLCLATAVKATVVGNWIWAVFFAAIAVACLGSVWLGYQEARRGR